MSERTPLDSLGPGTVLNVNDHEQQRYVVSKILRNAGYRVIEVATGLAAVDAVHVDLPEVVVLDIQLPDISGMEVCRRLKHELGADSPLVLHTSATFAGTDVRVRGLDVGGDAFLAQPFTPQELVATVRALVRRKRVEESQRRRAEEFAEADRRKDDFLAMLAHELRNPLNALTMSQAIIEQCPPQSPSEERARAVAKRQTVQLTRLVDDLLDVSRVTRGKITLDERPLDLCELLRDSATILQGTVLDGRQQTLRSSFPQHPVIVHGDRVRLAQVFANLIENASKYSPNGTSIDLELDLESWRGQPEATVVVTDSGDGIAEEQLSHVFNLFYQAKPTEARIGTGLGIGLTLVRALVELHGGTVTVRSEGLGKGSQFEIRLPAHEASALAAVPDTRRTATRRRREARGERTVLIVEDNADARELLSTLCQAWGYATETAADGLDGVDKALKSPPYVCLVDIGLPGIDGYEVARRLRAAENGSRFTLVALTGYGLPAQRQKALTAGFDLHLVKPVDADMLATLLEEPQKTIAQLSGRQAPRDSTS